MVKPWMFLFLLVCFYSVQADDAGAGSNNTVSVSSNRCFLSQHYDFIDNNFKEIQKHFELKVDMSTVRLMVTPDTITFKTV